MKGFGAWSVIAVGYLAAFAAAAGLVSLRYRGMSPTDVAASSGMYAFGDLLGTLILGAVFSLLPTWFALRRLRDADRLWGAVSRLVIGWAACGPLAAAVLWAASFAAIGEGTTRTISAVVHVLAVLRVVVAPGAAGAMTVAWWMCNRWPPVRRRFTWALGCEMFGMVVAGAWVVGLLAWR